MELAPYNAYVIINLYLMLICELCGLLSLLNSSLTSLLFTKKAYNFTSISELKTAKNVLARWICRFHFKTMRNEERMTEWSKWRKPGLIYVINGGWIGESINQINKSKRILISFHLMIELIRHSVAAISFNSALISFHQSNFAELIDCMKFAELELIWAGAIHSF